MKALRILWYWIFVTLAGPVSFANDITAIRDSSFSFTSPQPPGRVDPFNQADVLPANKDRRFDFRLSATDYCYIVIKVPGPVPASYTLAIDNTSLDTVLIYRLWAGGAKQLLYEGGNQIPYNTNRDYVWHTVPLAASQQPAYYLIAVKSISQNVNLACRILSTEKLRRAYRFLDRLAYFYSCFIVLISLISLTGYVVFKRKALLIYTGYVLSVAAWILAHYGYLYAWFFPDLPALNAVSKQVSSLMGMFCLLYLISGSFGTALNKKWINKSLLISKLITAGLLSIFLVQLIAGFSFYTLTVINILWHGSLLFSIGVVIAALVSLFTTSKTARIFSIAISLVSVTAVWQMVSNMGWLYHYFLNEHSMLLASLLEMLVLTAGIFYNVWEEKTHKEEELKIAEGERTKVLQMLIGVQDEERKRIAGDLHDSIGPMLAAIKINFMRMAKAKAENRAAEDLATKTENIIDDSIAEIRNISHQLMPKSLSSKGLITLLADYFTDLEAVHSIRIHFAHEINRALAKEVQLNLYRMISELSLNAAKHSEAKTLYVCIKTAPEETLVIMKDDGRGFTEEAKNGSSFGLKNVQSRVDYLKGKMQLESLPGKGTVIKISIPQVLPS